jgi:hypothetical protein
VQRLTKWTDVLQVFPYRGEEIADTVEPFKDRSDGESVRINRPL